MKTFQEFINEGGEDRLDTAGARLDRADRDHKMTHEQQVKHLIDAGHSPEIANKASQNRLNLRKTLASNPTSSVNNNQDYHAIKKIHSATGSYGIEGRDVTLYSNGRAVARNQRTGKYHSINSKGEVGTHSDHVSALDAIKK